MLLITVTSVLSIIAAFPASINSQAIPQRVTWNNFYDNGAQSALTLACAEWAAQHNIQTLSEVPRFPFVGGAFFVNGTNTGQCGEFNVLLDTQTGVGIEVTIVDAAAIGYVISLEAMNTLTDGQAQQLGSVEVIVF